MLVVADVHLLAGQEGSEYVPDLDAVGRTTVQHHDVVTPGGRNTADDARHAALDVLFRRARRIGHQLRRRRRNQPVALAELELCGLDFESRRIAFALEPCVSQILGFEAEDFLRFGIDDRCRRPIDMPQRLFSVTPET
jgi:hypothetical protein